MGRSLVWARLRYAPVRRLVAVLTLALAAAVPVLVAAVSSVTAGAALAVVLAALPPGERSVTVSYNGIADPATRVRYDAAVAHQLPRIAAAPIRRQVIFRQTTDGHGGALVFAGTDDLAAGVRLLQGRLPASCLPQRCEVVQLTDPQGAAATSVAAGPTLTPPPGLGLVVVGLAQRTDPLLLTASFAPEPGVPVLLADGVPQASALASLSGFGRTLGWVAPLGADRVRALGAQAWVAEGASVARDLSDTGEMLVVTAPEDAVRDADARARASAGRFALLGGSAAVLLLGSAVVAGTALRRDREAFDGALRRRGAGPGLRTLLVTGEVAATAVVGVLAGVVLTLPVVAVLATRVGVPVGATLTEALAGSAPAVLATTLAGSIVLALTLSLGGRTGARAAWRIADLSLVFCLVAGALVLARGGASTSTVSSGDPLLLVLPILTLAAVALVTARLWSPLVALAERGLARLSSGRAVGLRLGLTSAGGRPLRPVATAGLLAAAVAVTGFATAYRTTLDRGAADAAAYTSPFDVRLAPGTSSLRPQDALPPADLAAAVGAGGLVAPVVRVVASVAVTASVGEPVQLVGLSPQVLPRIARWSAVTGSSASPVELASAITVPAPSAGVRLPSGRRLHIATPGTPVGLVVEAHVRSDDDRERSVSLVVDAGTAAGPAGSAAADAAAGLEGVLPQLSTVTGGPVTWHLVGISLRQPASEADRRQHNLGEGHVDRVSPGVGIAWGAVSVDGTAVPDCWTGWAAIGASGGLTVRDGQRAELSTRLLDGAVELSARPAGLGSGEELPVLTDPLTAQAGPSLTLTLDTRPIRLRVVGVLDRFPVTRGRFVVADRQALARLTDLGAPGTGQGLEVWLAAGPGQAAHLGAAVHGGGFTGLTVTRQRTVLTALRADPVARGAQGLLLGGALLVLLVALLALVLLVLADRRDEAASMSAWEADGVAPATLRAALWWRAVAVVTPAVPIGVLAGLALSRLTAAIAAVTGTGATPVPPLATGVGVRGGLAMTGLVLAAGLGVAALVASRAWREPLPLRDDDFGGLR